MKTMQELKNILADVFDENPVSYSHEKMLNENEHAHMDLDSKTAANRKHKDKGPGSEKEIRANLDALADQFDVDVVDDFEDYINNAPKKTDGAKSLIGEGEGDVEEGLADTNVSIQSYGKQDPNFADDPEYKIVLRTPGGKLFRYRDVENMKQMMPTAFYQNPNFWDDVRAGKTNWEVVRDDTEAMEEDELHVDTYDLDEVGPAAAAKAGAAVGRGAKKAAQAAAPVAKRAGADMMDAGLDSVYNWAKGKTSAMREDDFDIESGDAEVIPDYSDEMMGDDFSDNLPPDPEYIASFLLQFADEDDIDLENGDAEEIQEYLNAVLHYEMEDPVGDPIDLDTVETALELIHSNQVTEGILGAVGGGILGGIAGGPAGAVGGAALGHALSDDVEKDSYEIADNGRPDPGPGNWLGLAFMDPRADEAVMKQFGDRVKESGDELLVPEELINQVEEFLDSSGFQAGHDYEVYDVLDEAAPVLGALAGGAARIAGGALAGAMSGDVEESSSDAAEVVGLEFQNEDAWIHFMDRFEDSVDYLDGDVVMPASEQGTIEQYMTDAGYEYLEDWSFVESVDEDCENGYGQHHSADGEDYFPSGATSPAAKRIGPGGKGDNRLGTKIPKNGRGVTQVEESRLMNRYEKMYRSIMENARKKD